jgi:hypothetical protein
MIRNFFLRIVVIYQNRFSYFWEPWLYIKSQFFDILRIMNKYHKKIVLRTFDYQFPFLRIAQHWSTINTLTLVEHSRISCKWKLGFFYGDSIFWFLTSNWGMEKCYSNYSLFISLKVFPNFYNEPIFLILARNWEWKCCFTCLSYNVRMSGRNA